MVLDKYFYSNFIMCLKADLSETNLIVFESQLKKKSTIKCLRADLRGKNQLY